MSSEDGVPFDKPMKMLFDVEIVRDGLFQNTVSLQAKFTLNKSHADLEAIIQERTRTVARRFNNKLTEEFRRELEFDLSKMLIEMQNMEIIEIKEQGNE